MFKRIGVVLLAVIHLVLLPGARRTIRDSGLAGLRLHRRGRRRPPLDADECRRRRATDLASLCSRGLLLVRRFRNNVCMGDHAALSIL